MYDIAGYLIYDLCGVPNPQVENLCAVNCYIYLMELNSVFLIWVSLMSDIDDSQKQCNEGPWSLFFIDRIMAYNNKWERNDNSIVCFNQVARLFWLKKDLLTWECCITPFHWNRISSQLFGKLVDFLTLLHSWMRYR